MTTYFASCTNLNELKAEYRRLVMENHPDRGGDVRKMQEINAEHDRVFNILKDAQNRKAQDPSNNVQRTTETPEEFRNIVEALLNLDGVEVELCGSWLWIAGDTKQHKEELKKLGCRWSKTKVKWYWRHYEAGAHWSRGRATMDEIRTKYGSEFLKVSDRKMITA